MRPKYTGRSPHELASHAATRLDELRKIVAHALDDLSIGLRDAGLLKAVGGVTGRAGLLEIFTRDVEAIYGGEHSSSLETFTRRVSTAAAFLARQDGTTKAAHRERASLIDRIL